MYKNRWFFLTCDTLAEPASPKCDADETEGDCEDCAAAMAWYIMSDLMCVAKLVGVTEPPLLSPPPPLLRLWPPLPIGGPAGGGEAPLLLLLLLLLLLGWCFISTATRAASAAATEAAAAERPAANKPLASFRLPKRSD